MLKIRVGLPIAFCFMHSISVAGSMSATYHHDFWRPTYHARPLSACLFDGVTCGKNVADRYCQHMGYARSELHMIDYNVGDTHFLGTKFSCHNWHCNSFKLIRCAKQVVHKPPAPYYFREREFLWPRYNQFRIDWCLERNQHCGKPAADSYCKRLGFVKAVSFKRTQKPFPATKTIGTEEICFGPSCFGFRKITCYR
jgi:hypothetical protein